MPTATEWIGALSLLIALAGCASPGSQESREREARRAADLKAIEELHRRDIAATKVYDIEALASLMTDDIVSLPPGQPPLVGKAANLAMLEAGREESVKYEVVEYEQLWKEVQVEGDYAFEWGVFKGAVRPKAGGDVIRQDYNVVRVLKRQPDGSWKVHRTTWNNAPATD